MITGDGEDTRLAGIKRDVEALLFAAGAPLSTEVILEALSLNRSDDRHIVEGILRALAVEFPPEGHRGFELVRLAGG